MHLCYFVLEDLVDCEHPSVSVSSVGVCDELTEPMAIERGLALERVADDDDGVVLAAAVGLVDDLEVRDGDGAADSLLQGRLGDGHGGRGIR